jgi:putative chitinase
MLTLSNFQKATGVSNALRDTWYPHIVSAMTKFGITNALRQTHFLAQTGHESAGFLKLEEGLNYSEGALKSMFGRRISAEQARMYGRNS